MKFVPVKMTVLIVCMILASYSLAFSSGIKDVETLIGSNDSLLVTADDGEVLAAKNENSALVPASTLKILTSLCAIHYLGEDYRFSVNFYLKDNLDLVVKGFGDPLLVSEVVEKYCSDVSKILSSRKIKSIRNIIVDDSYFAPGIIIPGATLSSDQPYDAPVGALGVNFNSISFKTSNGKLDSLEPQTPLTRTAFAVAKKSGLKSGRIPLPSDRRTVNNYSGEVFRFYLEKAGVKVGGDVKEGSASKDDVKIHTAVSPYELKDSLSKLLEFSSNFMANQVFLAVAAKYSGKPATLSDGAKAAKQYAEGIGVKDLSIVEGSGLSRQNRISAVQMDRILKEFYPYHELMKRENGVFFKTGTLDGVSARAGYIKPSNGDELRFVILLNSGGKNAEAVLSKLKMAAEEL